MDFYVCIFSACAGIIVCVVAVSLFMLACHELGKRLRRYRRNK